MDIKVEKYMKGSWIIKKSLQKICAEENIAYFLKNFLVKVYQFDNKTNIFNLFQKNRKVLLRYLREAISCTSSNLLQKDYTCPIPSHYCIEPGNICNLRCRFCPTGRRLKGFRRGFLSLENFKTMFDKIAPYAKRIAFYNWGEPLLNKDILSMVSMCTDNGIRTDFDSNLNVYIGDKEAEAIVKSGLSAMVASIDGASQETYEKYRVGGNFKLAVDNLERLQNAKERLNIETPNLIWRFLINKFNEHEVEKAKEIASNIGVPLTFSLMGCSEGIFGGGGDSSWKSSLHPKEDYYSDFKIILHNPTDLPVPVGSIVLHPKLFGWCIHPFKLMFIHWDGSVLPCCNVFGDEYIIGNLLKQDIESIWNSKQFLACRNFLYNYGPKQNTGSVCETLPCRLDKKYLI